MATVATKGISTGRRKEAVARVRLVPGTGTFALNGRTLEEYFTTRAHRMVVAAPLRVAGREKDFDVVATIHGGGVNGQAGALRLGCAVCSRNGLPVRQKPLAGQSRRRARFASASY